MFYDQSAYEVRLEWGRAGLEKLARADVTVIIDVLSFSTSVDIAVERGALVFPYAWKDDRAVTFAEEQGAVLASPRIGKGYSLSPTSLLGIETGTRLVLPSPNGSSLSTLADRTFAVLSACLRNVESVAQHINAHCKTVNLIPAGERWEDGSLRPAFEDYLGAGAVISYLRGSLSPEATAAKAAFTACKDNLREVLETCASGRELLERGFGKDIELAADLGDSRAVPGLESGTYRNVSKG